MITVSNVTITLMFHVMRILVHPQYAHDLYAPMIKKRHV